jgi:hypothetical protein
MLGACAFAAPQPKSAAASTIAKNVLMASAARAGFGISKQRPA